MYYEVVGIKITCINGFVLFLWSLLTGSETHGMTSEHELQYWNYGDAEKHMIQKWVLRHVAL